ncbi:MAG: 50S ribosomal protein L18 [Myxococcota bacterium]
MNRKHRNDETRRRAARRGRVKRKVERSDRPQLTVYRSSKHIYAQIIDAVTGKTITSVSTRTKGVMGDAFATGNIEAAKCVGKAIADAAKDKQIGRVVFNRNGFLYHGRVKALAEAAREAGLQF